MLSCDAIPKRRTVAAPRKEVTVRAVRPNVGVEAAYRRKLEKLIGEMNDSIDFWLTSAYRANEPAVLAQDENPISLLQRAFTKLSRRWQRKFDDLAKEMADHFAKSAADRSDFAFRAALKDSGFAVDFKLTDHARNALNAVIEENVGLIKSIASEHLTDVQGILMRSASTGRDLGTMSKELQERFGVTRRRAAFIARDQNNKATAVIVKSRQQELGITEAVWLHSRGGKHPRPSHVAASGKKYDIEKGMFLDGVWTWPGHEINCRCVSKSVVRGLT